MLGEFGETLVVGWGLAKALGQEEEETTAERPMLFSSGSSAPTEVGRTVGTPGFMPPEQARGEHERTGPASDVFALGATLYCLLAGSAPYTGPDALARAAKGQHRPARELNPRVPQALEAVCAKAMALAPEGRYATARLLAVSLLGLAKSGFFRVASVLDNLDRDADLDSLRNREDY